MPTISAFYGLLIQMFWNDHPPPHFHVEYNEYKATIEIQSLNIIKGKLPLSARKLVMEWAQQHQSELLEDWELCREDKSPKPIKPLD